MQSLLSDIIMDVQELKVLVESGVLGADAETGKIVLRKIERMKGRLDSLADEVVLEMHKADVVETVFIPDVSLSENAETALADSSAETDVVADKQEFPVEEVVETVLAEPERVMGERMDCFDSLRSSFSLNDSFRFSRELFKGDLQTFYQVVDGVSKAGSRSEAERMLGETLSAVDNEEVKAELFEHVGRFFS